MHKNQLQYRQDPTALIPTHQIFIIALAKGLIAPLNTSTKPIEYCSLDKD
jgi:hypothetical protein